MDHLQSCSSLLPTCCQISLKGYGRAHHKQGKMSPELLKTPAAWCNTHQLIWQIRKYNTTCKVSFKKWNRWPHWRLWGIPKGSGISHTQCIYRFICKEQTVWCILLFRFYQNAPRPTSPYLRSGQTGRMFQKHPWTALQRIQGQCWMITVLLQLGAVQHLITKVHNENPEWICRFYPHARNSRESQNTRTFGLEHF